MKLGDTHINLIKYDHEKDLRVTFDKSIYLDVHPMPLAKSTICLDWLYDLLVMIIVPTRSSCSIKH